MSDNAYETGFLRVINHSALAGAAQLELIGSVNRSLSSVTLVLDAKSATNVGAAALTFETTDNDSYVSTGGKRVRISSELDIEAYVQIPSENDSLEAVSYRVPGDGFNRKIRIATFNAASDLQRTSYLQLMNANEYDARRDRRRE